YIAHVRSDGNRFKIFTLEGVMDALPGDWIIRGVQGEHYPCKPDIFAATYDPAELQERRKAEVPGYPETLPCPVFLEPGLKFGKGVSTRLVLDALRRRADYYAELEGMTPEQRAEHSAGIAELKAMLGHSVITDTPPVPVVKLPTTRCWAGISNFYYAADVIAAIRAAGVEVSND
ncbi:hypothetical protein FRN05_24005, partial [Salmonella enterica subsp. enterica]|nr:hypothetical protein [Salmonella enterica subsp. enterica serovar Meleagridis]